MKPGWCSVTVFSLGMKSWVPYLSVPSTLCRFDDTADDSLGHARAGVAFVDGTCSHCESVAMGIYHLSAFLCRKSPRLLPVLVLLLLCTRPQQQALRAI